MCSSLISIDADLDVFLFNAPSKRQVALLLFQFPPSENERCFSVVSTEKDNCPSRRSHNVKVIFDLFSNKKLQSIARRRRRRKTEIYHSGRNRNNLFIETSSSRLFFFSSFLFSFSSAATHSLWLARTGSEKERKKRKKDKREREREKTT